MDIGFNTIDTSLGEQQDIKNEPSIQWIDPYFNKYFDKNEIREYKIDYPCKKCTLITTLRKIGNIKNQYVTNLYYLDTLIFSRHGEIYSIYNDSLPLYSPYHSEWNYCKKHKQMVIDNLIIGFKIYPRGVIPEKTYKERKEEWKKFQ